MTTIAFDGKTIVSDSYMDASGIKMFAPYKVWQEGISPHDGIRGWKAFIGVAGEYAYAMKYKAKTLLCEGGELLPLDEADMQHISAMAVVCTDGIAPEIHVATITGQWMPYHGREKHAIGSGRDFALAAMHCGKSALEAVEVARHFDTGTGGAVHAYDVAAA